MGTSGWRIPKIRIKAPRTNITPVIDKQRRFDIHAALDLPKQFSQCRVSFLEGFGIGDVGVRRRVDFCEEAARSFAAGDEFGGDGAVAVFFFFYLSS
jgi:hypothetical protein